MKHFIKILSLTLFFLTFSCHVFAADINITCNSTNCSPSTNPALFSSTEVWYPGKTITKTINLNNISGDPISINLTNSNTSSTGDLDSVISFTITRVLTGTNLFNDIIKNYYGTTITLPILTNNTNEDYSFTATMLPEAGNEYQNKNTSFDLSLNFTVGSPPTPTPTPTTSTGNGAVSGATTITTSVCNDAKPANSPILQSAVAGLNSVTLTWLEAGDPVSYYLIAYGVSPNNNTYGNPDVGGKGTTSYTVTNLSGGITYCFIVRAGNGCTPGDFSNQICATPFGGFIASAVAPGFAPGVLGESTTSAELISTPSATKGEIKGVKTANMLSCKNCLWWQILLGEFVVLLIYFLIISRKFQLKKAQLIGLVIPILIYIIFLILNRGCLINWIFVLSENFFCKYFLLIDTSLFIIFTLIWKKKNTSQA